MKFVGCWLFSVLFLNIKVRGSTEQNSNGGSCGYTIQNVYGPEDLPTYGALGVNYAEIKGENGRPGKAGPQGPRGSMGNKVCTIRFKQIFFFSIMEIPLPIFLQNIFCIILACGHCNVFHSYSF